VVHMAAWHGIHETTGAKDVYAFWDLNVTGTMNVFEAAHRAGVTQLVYLSSTSVRNYASLYGQTKVLGEAIAQTYRTRHGMQVVILRPRGFIPHWNRATYASFVAWLQWFWRGAVHIEDVAHAVVRSLDFLATTVGAPPGALVVDGAYEYTAADWPRGTPRDRAPPSKGTMQSIMTWRSAMACSPRRSLTSTISQRPTSGWGMCHAIASVMPWRTSPAMDPPGRPGRRGACQAQRPQPLRCHRVSDAESYRRWRSPTTYRTGGVCMALRTVPIIDLAPTGRRQRRVSGRLRSRLVRPAATLASSSLLGMGSRWT